MDAAGALPFKARLARRSAASRLSSTCFVETVAICAARRSAELGRRAGGWTDTVTFCLTATTVSFSVSLISADHGIRGFAHLSASWSRSPADSARKTTVISSIFPPRVTRLGSPSRASASGRRSARSSDRVDLLWSWGHPDAGCAVVVARQLTTRTAAIRDRNSTRLAYALPDHVLSAP
jgi:hypothetical protein